MPSASLWAIFSGKIIFILRLSRPAGFSFSLFHGKGRNGKRQLAGAGSLLGNEPSQALRASSPEGRAKTVEGTLLASPFERLPPVGGRCRAATKRRQGVTEGDGEGAPAPLRGAAAAAAEGPINRRSEKKSATATTAASGGYREELLGQRPAGCECRPRHEADAGCRNPSERSG